jgi:hypothetical protein
MSIFATKAPRHKAGTKDFWGRKAETANGGTGLRGWEERIKEF